MTEHIDNGNRNFEFETEFSMMEITILKREIGVSIIKIYLSIIEIEVLKMEIDISKI